MQLFIENLNNIFSLNYWFVLNPQPFLPVVLKVLYVFFGLFLISGIACKFVSKKHQSYAPLRNVWSKFYYFLITFGAFGLVIIFFRQQHVYFLGAPFWMIVWFLLAVVWLIFIIRYILVKVPKIKEDIKLKKEMEKYLP